MNTHVTGNIGQQADKTLRLFWPDCRGESHAASSLQHPLPESHPRCLTQRRMANSPLPKGHHIQEHLCQHTHPDICDRKETAGVCERYVGTLATASVCAEICVRKSMLAFASHGSRRPTQFAKASLPFSKRGDSNAHKPASRSRAPRAQAQTGSGNQSAPSNLSAWTSDLQEPEFHAGPVLSE